jgi:hypothetical protein
VDGWYGNVYETRNLGITSLEVGTSDKKSSVAAADKIRLDHIASFSYHKRLNPVVDHSCTSSNCLCVHFIMRAAKHAANQPVIL